MLFSTKSGPNWLDRLRSNKGFAADDSLNLDHFLNHNPTSDPPNPNASSIPSRPGFSTRPGEAMLGLMTTAIYELFYIDGSDERSIFNGKKVPRKQTHPRVCVISSVSTKHKSASGGIGSDDVTTTVPFTLTSSKNEEGEIELRGCSKSEVTVIDTSCEVWKTDKVVFRRKSVWKVREKMCKVRSFGRNKRKDVSDDDDVGIEEKKKKRKEKEAEDQCVSLNPIFENSHNGARKEVCQDTSDNMLDPSKDLEKGLSSNFPLKPRKPIKDGLSVYFIKGIPTDDKNEGKLPKKNSYTRLD